MSQKTLYNFTALLSLFPTENGGRKKPVFNNYKPSFGFNTQQFFSGEISLLEEQQIRPGDTGLAFVKLLPSRHIRQNLKSGDVFSIHEGSKIVGVGVIQRIDESRVNVS